MTNKEKFTCINCQKKFPHKKKDKANVKIVGRIINYELPNN
jgi:hypothetical protein